MTEFSQLISETFPASVGSELGRMMIGPGGFFEVVEEDVRGETMAVFKNRARSLVEVMRTSTAAYPDREYVADEERRLTYPQHLAAAAVLARILREEYDVEPGDVVGIYSANSVEWVVAYWGILAGGGVAAAMNSFWSDPETAAALELAKPKVVLVDDRRAEVLNRVDSNVPRLLLDDALYSRVTAEPDAELPDVAIAEDDTALLLFTSGTTGTAKAVVHTHRAVIGIFQTGMLNILLRMGGIPAEMPPPPRVLVGPPLFHLSGMAGAANYMAAGGLIILRPGRFDEERVLQTLENERVTHWMSIGSAAPRVALHPDLAKCDLSSLQMVMVGGAPLSPAVKHMLYDTFPKNGEGMLMGYTSTEGGVQLAVISGPQFVEDAESTGPIQDGVQVAVLDDSGRRLGEGEEGHIHARSAYTMVEFLNQPDETAKVYREGRWLNMGDIGRIEGGLLYINSRARDLIFVSSENVYPSEIENRLEEHPAVVECCALGIDDTITGQAVKAFVVLPEASSVTAEELAEWCRGGLPPYKVPTSWVLTTELLPRNATGKLLRTVLAEP